MLIAVAAMLIQSAVPPLPESGGAAAAAYARLSDQPCHKRMMEPAEAIEGAAKWAGARSGLPGCFRLVVRRVGDDGHGNLFLDSEDDYRDPGSLNVRVIRRAVLALKRLLATDDVAAALTGRTLLVTGTATRKRIAFLDRHGPIGKYYFQTQVLVVGTGQLARPPA